METLRREMGAFGWLIRALLMGAVAAAVYKELQLPPEKRTWQGRLFGFVPYDFRMPSPKRMLRAWWDPKTDRLFNDQPFGVGWAVNLPTALKVVRRAVGATPPARRRKARSKAA
jgi:hypothetical protein